MSLARSRRAGGALMSADEGQNTDENHHRFRRKLTGCGGWQAVN